MDIQEAKKILIDKGYVIVKVTLSMNEKMDKCASGEDEDCDGCCACVCLLQNI